MNARNLDLAALVVGTRVGLVKINGDRVAGTITHVRYATKAQGLRYTVQNHEGSRTVEAVDIASFVTF